MNTGCIDSHQRLATSIFACLVGSEYLPVTARPGVLSCKRNSHRSQPHVAGLFRSYSARLHYRNSDINISPRFPPLFSVPSLLCSLSSTAIRSRNVSSISASEIFDCCCLRETKDFTSSLTTDEWFEEFHCSKDPRSPGLTLGRPRSRFLRGKTTRIIHQNLRSSFMFVFTKPRRTQQVAAEGIAGGVDSIIYTLSPRTTAPRFRFLRKHERQVSPAHRSGIRQRNTKTGGESGDACSGSTPSMVACCSYFIRPSRPHDLLEERLKQFRQFWRCASTFFRIRFSSFGWGFIVM